MSLQNGALRWPGRWLPAPGAAARFAAMTPEERRKLARKAAASAGRRRPQRPALGRVRRRTGERVVTALQRGRAHACPPCGRRAARPSRSRRPRHWVGVHAGPPPPRVDTPFRMCPCVIVSVAPHGGHAAAATSTLPVLAVTLVVLPVRRDSVLELPQLAGDRGRVVAEHVSVARPKHDPRTAGGATMPREAAIAALLRSALRWVGHTEMNSPRPSLPRNGHHRTRSRHRARRARSRRPIGTRRRAR
jgi:hypothetical protein